MSRTLPSFKLIDTFIAVAAAGSVDQAATRLGSKSTTVSQQLKLLEEQLDIPLFDRSTRPLRLTKLGSQFLAKVSDIRNDYLDALSDLSPQNRPGLAELALGIIDDFNASLSPHLAERVRSASPNTQVTVLSGRSDSMIQMIERRRVDACITGQFPAQTSDLSTRGMLREKLVLIHSRYSPLSGLEGDALASSLSQYPYIAYEGDSPLGQLINQHLKRLCLAPSASFTFDNNRSIFELVKATGGWAITTPLNVLEAIDDNAQFGVRELPFTDISRTLWLVTTPDLTTMSLGEKRGKAGDFLVGAIRDYLADHLPKAMEKAMPHLSTNAVELII